MGCCGSSPDTSVLGDVAEIRATKHFFGLSELPVNLKADVQGNRVEVVAVGLAQTGLLASLELGFQCRRFWIMDASVTSRLGLFKAIFNLAPFNQNEHADTAEKTYFEACNRVVTTVLSPVDPLLHSPVSPSKDYPLSPTKIFYPQGKHTTAAPFDVETPPTSPKGQRASLCSVNTLASNASLILESDKDARKGTSSELAEVDAEAARDGAIVRLTIVRKLSQGIRAAITEMLNTKGLEVTFARLSCVRSKIQRHHMIKDTLWLAPTNQGQYSLGDVQDGKPQWLIDLGLLVQSRSPKKDYAYLGNTSCLSLLKDDMINELKTKHSETLPQVLQQCSKSLPYDLHMCSDLGLQVDDFAKFVGEGMTTSHFDGKNVLEFSTFFVATKDAIQGGTAHQNWLSGMLRNTKGYAEFVTQYEPVSRRLTIFKVFLNSTLPCGQGLGFRAAAEQLLNAKSLGYSCSMLDGPAALRGLRQLHLCDVVNWNTYAILSKVGKEPDSDLEEWVLKEELAAAGLQLQDLKSSSVEDIFAKTALGKFVHGMLKDWSRAGLASHRVKKVSVLLNSQKHEMVCNEYRAVMDVRIKLENDPFTTAHEDPSLLCTI